MTRRGANGGDTGNGRRRLSQSRRGIFRAARLPALCRRLVALGARRRRGHLRAISPAGISASPPAAGAACSSPASSSRIMYLGLVFSIAEMSPGAAAYRRRLFLRAHRRWGRGAASSPAFARTSNTSSRRRSSSPSSRAYVNSIFGFDAAYSPLIWIVLLRDLPGAEHFRRGASLPRDAGRDAAVARRPGHLLDQRHPEHGLQPLGAEHRRPDGSRAAGGQRPVVPVRLHRRAGDACLSPSGCSSPSSSCRSRRRNRSIRSATCRRASSSAW